MPRPLLAIVAAALALVAACSAPPTPTALRTTVVRIEILSTSAKQDLRVPAGAERKDAGSPARAWVRRAVSFDEA